LKHSYRLEVPDLRAVLNRKEVMILKVFFQNAPEGCRKIEWHITSSETGYTMHNIQLFYGRLKAVEIDFKNACIVFYKGADLGGEFTELLVALLENTYIHINSDEMHFVASTGRSRKKEHGAMR
jgi:hypothetical protein